MDHGVSGEFAVIYQQFFYFCAFCPPIDSIITLTTVWRITGKIIRTTIMLITYARV